MYTHHKNKTKITFLNETYSGMHTSMADVTMKTLFNIIHKSINFVINQYQTLQFRSQYYFKQITAALFY